MNALAILCDIKNAPAFVMVRVKNNSVPIWSKASRTVIIIVAVKNRALVCRKDRTKATVQNKRRVVQSMERRTIKASFPHTGDKSKKAINMQIGMDAPTLCWLNFFILFFTCCSIWFPFPSIISPIRLRYTYPLFAVVHSAILFLPLLLQGFYHSLFQALPMLR